MDDMEWDEVYTATHEVGSVEASLPFPNRYHTRLQQKWRYYFALVDGRPHNPEQGCSKLLPNDLFNSELCDDGG